MSLRLLVPARPRPYSIKIFVADGAPEGLRIVEKSGWTGVAVVCRRDAVPEKKVRDEFGRTGVYVLVSSGKPEMVYVGEGDPVRPRIEKHFVEKDWWDWLVLFTSKDLNLNKAHVQHLEARLVALARDAGRYALDNGNVPQVPSLSEAEAAEMEAFLHEMLSIYPLVGLTAFEKPADTQGAPRLAIQRPGFAAHAYRSSQGFVVQKGSQASSKTAPSLQPFLVDLRDGLRDRGILADKGGTLVFTQDYAFGSPSTAAGVVLGRSANGLILWKDEQGRTLKEMEEAALAPPKPRQAPRKTKTR